jgi:arsenite/tail-anchored protein-transporting ATPase
MQIPPDLRLHLISGKGGVGKSTFACALAQQLAVSGKQVWLVSADPAHSIGDVLAQPVGGEAVTVGQHPHWHAWALDGEKELQDFRQKYQQAVALITENSSLFDSGDLVGLWNLSWPGFDEVMAVIRVSQLLLTGEADVVVLDMAPTGHAMRLLEYPAFIEKLIAVFESLHHKQQTMQQAFAGKQHRNASDDFLEEFTMLLRGLKDLLHDRVQTAVWVVLLPEELSIPETGDFLSFLQASQLPVGGIIINQIVVPDSPLSTLWAQQQQKRLQRLLELPRAKDIAIWQMPLLAEEPIGEERLAKLFGYIKPFTLLENLLPTETSWVLPAPSSSPLPDYVALNQKLVLMAGKGGVGKTTTSAALALKLAHAHPDKKILIVSIDPAHSLGDAFNQNLGAQPVLLQHNLWGQEVSPEATLAKVIDSLRAVLDGLNRDNMSIEEVQTWQYLLDKPPPGLDEIAALLTIINPTDTVPWDTIILDTAPTGHLLRFLQMPQALESWLTYLLRLWVKYRTMFADDRLAQQFRTWRKQVLQLQKDLIDPNYTCALPILTPETTVLQETVRLVAQLNALNLNPTHMVVNRVMMDISSPILTRITARHQHIQIRIQEHFPEQVLHRVPFLPTLPKGIAGLEIYGKYL